MKRQVRYVPTLPAPLLARPTAPRWHFNMATSCALDAHSSTAGLFYENAPLIRSSATLPPAIPGFS